MPSNKQQATSNHTKVKSCTFISFVVKACLVFFDWFFVLIFNFKFRLIYSLVEYSFFINELIFFHFPQKTIETISISHFCLTFFKVYYSLSLCYVNIFLAKYFLILI